jgi:hypothetical protein
VQTLITRVVLLAMTTLLCVQAVADDSCSLRSLAGRWMFATGIGHQGLGPPFPEGKDITAIGLFTIGRQGGLSGTFDATVQDTFFLPANTFTGSITMNRDCSGTLTFITSAGTARTDTIVVVSRKEMLGMSQDPANLWTYQVRRLPGWTTARDRD